MDTMMKTTRLKIWLHRREITRWVMIILFVMGSVLLGFAVFLTASFYSAPAYSFKAGYSGFEIAHNDSIIPRSMIVGITVNPPDLYFDYSFSLYANGTYNFIFAFPFYIVSTEQASDNLSVKSTSHGSAIGVQYMVNNVTEYGMGRQISGDFVIENTFQEGTRETYTIILPFGMGVSPEVTYDLWQTLKVPYYSDVNITLWVALPTGFKPTTAFPPSRGLEFPPTPLNVTLTQASMVWDAGTLQNSVTIEAVNTDEKSFYDNIPFTSGILLAIGLQFMFTTGYDFFRKWGNSQEEES